jgi:catechol 2,3-dioxygenase-like lactoylglutathione lyase family enzyme
MEIIQETKSIRTFIGAKDYEISRSFYRDLGFEEKVISEKMSLFTIQGLSFYLQDYYVKDWIENSMVLLEVGDVNRYWNFLQKLELDKKYEGTRLIPIRENDWGKECFLVDPSGVLWHFAEFNR